MHVSQGPIDILIQYEIFRHVNITYVGTSIINFDEFYMFVDWF